MYRYTASNKDEYQSMRTDISLCLSSFQMCVECIFHHFIVFVMCLCAPHACLCACVYGSVCGARVCVSVYVLRTLMFIWPLASVCLGVCVWLCVAVCERMRENDRDRARGVRETRVNQLTWFCSRVYQYIHVKRYNDWRLCVIRDRASFHQPF